MGAISDFQERRARGESSARAQAEGFLGRIAARNRELNAFTRIDADAALRAAGESDARAAAGALRGALDGAALAIKDNIAAAGLPCAAGIAAWRDRRPPRDAGCLAALRAQGAVILGKTHMDEAALGALGDNAWLGRCQNPGRAGFTPGGSSSGSAVAVAAQLCVAALGTDTLGSVRIPASYCGVVGYVPTRGCIGMDGVVPLAPRFDRIGVLAASVADAALVAGAMSGGKQDPSRGAKPVKVGFLRGIESFTAPEMVAAAEEAARALERAGCEVIDVAAPDFDWRGARRAAFLLTEAAAALAFGSLLDDPGAEISPALRRMLQFGRDAGVERIAGAQGACERALLQTLAMLSECDVLLLPATPQTAFAFDAVPPESQADLAAPASIAGLPAITVPAAGRADALPIGIQLVADAGKDARLLGIAALLA